MVKQFLILFLSAVAGNSSYAGGICPDLESKFICDSNSMSYGGVEGNLTYYQDQNKTKRIILLSVRQPNEFRVETYQPDEPPIINQDADYSSFMGDFCSKGVLTREKTNIKKTEEHRETLSFKRTQEGNLIIEKSITEISHGNLISKLSEQVICRLHSVANGGAEQ